MIHTVRIKGFKRFGEIEFRLPAHVVLAGPNNMGKTTVLQAIASWAFALRRWRELNDFNPRNGFMYAAISRPAFTTVPLRSFDLLWKDRAYAKSRLIEIELQSTDGWSITMEFYADTTEQIYVRPKEGQYAGILPALDIGAVYIPPMTGLGVDEPVYQPAKIAQLLGLGRPGEVLRNLVVEAYADRANWDALQQSIDKLFGYILLPPDANGAHIVSEYQSSSGGRALDIASAGSGFQQVLMLLALLNARPGALLLLDEPDAHLHVILQDAIYYELRAVARRRDSQLVVATHSEVVIDNVEPRELYVMLDEPRRIADDSERSRLVSSLRVLSNADVMQAMGVRGILYVEDYTDMDLLRAWATNLEHRAATLLTHEIMWKPAVFQTTHGSFGSSGIKARDHYDALQLVRDDLPALELIDGDAHHDIQSSEITGTGMQRLRWRRYEIESYLVHPDALQRFVEVTYGKAGAASHIEGLRAWWLDEMPPAVVRDPLGNHEYLNVTKARTRLIPPLLEAAGLGNLRYNRFHEIAQLMQPDEIHPEVKEKLDAICRAFGVEP